MTISPSSLQIGEIIRHALVFDLKNATPSVMIADSLTQIVQKLFDLLEERGTLYVLVGGIALLTYVEGRNTQDIDLLMPLDALKNLPEIKITDQNLDFARGEYEGLQIDILLTSNPLFNCVYQQHATQRQFRERMITTATVEGLLLLKLYALPSLYRQGSFARVALYENDIAVLLHGYSIDLSVIYATLKPVLNAGDFAEIKNILDEIQQRIARYRNKTTLS